LVSKIEGQCRIQRSRAAFKKRLLEWMSEASGEQVLDWDRVSHEDIVCFVLNRLSPGIFNLHEISDGVERFARVGNWKIVNEAMRKLRMNWDYDQVKLVLVDQQELERAIHRWEIRNLEEPLEPPSPDEWNDPNTPSWFTQLTAKQIEENRLAMGESKDKRQMNVLQNDEEVINARELRKRQRVSIADQMKGVFRRDDEKHSKV
jgi:hypothetical protein